MTIHQKLTRLMRHSVVSKVAREAGVNGPALRASLSRESRIDCRVAARLARALEVDVGWLIDDTRDWPPVRTTPAMDRELETSAA